MKDTGICIQIGLDFTAEMNYLTLSDWKKQIVKQVTDKRIPKSVYKNIKNWRFIGVDENPDSVAKIKDQYPNQEFICKSIKTGADLEHLFGNLNIEEVDVLVMDLEGDEFTVLSSYDGKIVPKFLSVECHRWRHDEEELLDMHGRHQLQGFADKYGLKLHRVIPTNQEYEYPTVELQYMREAEHLMQVKDHDVLTIHCIGLAHTITRSDFNACAFTMKYPRLIEAMVNRGHDMKHYGNAGADVACEHIDVVPKEFYEKNFGRHLTDRNKVYNIAEYSDYTRTFNMRACSDIRMRAKAGDIALINYGACADQLVNMLSDIQGLILCEFSVGYINAQYAPYRVFESYSNQDFHKGGWNKVWEYNQNNENHPIDSIHNTSPQFMDDVVPIFLDPRQFDHVKNEDKENFYLFLGRIQWSKGLDLAVKTCEKLGERLIVVGQGDFKEAMGYDPPPCVELKGHADVEERRYYMSKAKGGWVCTYYPEPGGHVMIEYLLSGTPIITTDWGNMPHININSVTGYRVRSGAEAEMAVRHINSGNIKSYHCRKWAMNYTMDRQARAYEYYFRRLKDHVMRGNNNDLYYEQSDVDLSIRDLIHPKDMEYDIDLNLVSEKDVQIGQIEISIEEGKEFKLAGSE